VHKGWQNYVSFLLFLRFLQSLAQSVGRMKLTSFFALFLKSNIGCAWEI